MPSSTPSVALAAAIDAAQRALNGTHNGHPPTVEYFAKDDGSVALTHAFQVTDERGAWYEAFVDAHSGELVSVTDYVTQLTYKVLPITKQDPTDGFQTLVDPEDLTASPEGWVTGTSTA
jgi:extracellular elastinolytic metalloproteinase